MFGANTFIDHLNIFRRHPYTLEKVSNALRYGNGMSAGHMAEKGVTGANNAVMSRVDDSVYTRFLCRQAGVQVSGVEMAMYHIWPFLFNEGSQIRDSVPIKKVVFIDPWVNHFHKLRSYIEPGELLAQWAWSRANNFDIYPRFLKPLHEIEHMILGSPDDRVANNLHNCKHSNTSL